MHRRAAPAARGRRGTPAPAARVKPATVPPARSTRSSVRLGRAAGGQHVVDDQHPLAGGERVRVHLEGRLAVLQRVRRRVASRRGSLPALRTGTTPVPVAYAIAAATTKPRASMPATTSNESGAVVRDDRVDHLPERRPVGEQRHQVLEDDARLGEVGHVDDPARPPAPADRRAAVASRHRCRSPSRRSPPACVARPWRRLPQADRRCLPPLGAAARAAGAAAAAGVAAAGRPGARPRRRAGRTRRRPASAPARPPRPRRGSGAAGRRRRLRRRLRRDLAAGEPPARRASTRWVCA